MPCVKHAGAPLENATFDEENMESISEFAEQIISAVRTGLCSAVRAGKTIQEEHVFTCKRPIFH